MRRSVRCVGANPLFQLLLIHVQPLMPEEEGVREKETNQMLERVGNTHIHIAHRTARSAQYSMHRAQPSSPPFSSTYTCFVNETLRT